MFETFIFVGYLIRILNYPKRMTLFDLTHMISMFDLVTIGVETLWTDSGCSLGREFT